MQFKNLSKRNEILLLTGQYLRYTKFLVCNYELSDLDNYAINTILCAIKCLNGYNIRFLFHFIYNLSYKAF